MVHVEDAILLCAAHPRPAAERRGRLARLLAAPPDWPRLLHQAERHGMTALLHSRLAGLPPALVPDAARATLARGARRQLVWNLTLHRELIRLLGELNRAGIRVMPLKGSLLADQLWGDLGLRPTSDIDLLVPGAEGAAAERTLANAGCRRMPEAEQGADYHVSYAAEGAGAGQVVVELHRDLAERHATRLDVEEVWASARRTPWQGREIWTMAPADLFLYLCLHAVKDGLGSLTLLVDIALAAEQFGDAVRWPELADRVRAARLRTPVYQTLLLTRSLLGGPIPPEFLSAIRPPRGPSWIASQALLRWRGGVLHARPELLVGPVMAVLLMLWEDSLAGRLRHLRRSLAPPASLRARRMSLAPSSSAVRWYPAWLAHVAIELARQVAGALRPPPRGRGPSCPRPPQGGSGSG